MNFLLTTASLLIVSVCSLLIYFILSKNITNRSLSGFILISISTCIPEALISMHSVISGKTAIILPAIIGSNIVNFTLAMGLYFIKFKDNIITKSEKNAMVYFFSIYLISTIIVLVTTRISFITGPILISLFVLYCFLAKPNLIDSNRDTKTFANITKRSLLQIALVFALCVFFAWVFTINVPIVSTSYGIEISTLSSLFISICSALPELALCLLTKKNQSQRIVLNYEILLSTLFNMLVILGVCGIFTTYVIDLRFRVFDVFFMLCCLCFVYLFLTANRFKTVAIFSGFVMMALYAVYISRLIFI